MGTFIVTIKRDRLDGKGKGFSFAQKEFMASNNRKLFNLILDRIEDEEDDGNVIVDVMNITQVM